MATAKTWYWLALGVLVLSFGSSNTARCLTSRVSAAADHLFAGSASFVALAEMALGRTPANYECIPPRLAPFLAAQARLQATQALALAQLMRAEIVREDIKPPFVANAVVAGNPTTVVVCPRTRVRIAIPRIPAPSVTVVEDPL